MKQQNLLCINDISPIIYCAPARPFGAIEVSSGFVFCFLFFADTSLKALPIRQYGHRFCHVSAEKQFAKNSLNLNVRNYAWILMRRTQIGCRLSRTTIQKIPEFRPFRRTRMIFQWLGVWGLSRVTWFTFCSSTQFTLFLCLSGHFL